MYVRFFVYLVITVETRPLLHRYKIAFQMGPLLDWHTTNTIKGTARAVAHVAALYY